MNNQFNDIEIVDFHQKNSQYLKNINDIKFDLISNFFKNILLKNEKLVSENCVVYVQLLQKYFEGKDVVIKFDNHISFIPHLFINLLLFYIGLKYQWIQIVIVFVNLLYIHVFIIILLTSIYCRVFFNINPLLKSIEKQFFI